MSALAVKLLVVRAAIEQTPPFNTTVPGDIMTQFQNQRITWTTNIWVYANALFGILAVIEFTWSAAVMLLPAVGEAELPATVRAGIALAVLGVFLVINLSVSAGMNRWDRRLQAQGR